MKPRRPFLLWLLCFIFIFAGIAYLLQAIWAIQSWNLLIVVGYRFGPLYPVFQGLVLASVFFIGAVLLFLQVHWATAFNGAAVLFASTWFWLDRLVFNLNPQPLQDQSFTLVVFILLLGLVLGGLWSIQPYMIFPKEARQGPQPLSSSGGINEQK